MIIDSKGMKALEENSGFATIELMEKAGSVVAEALKNQIQKDDNILILCGKGNNGGDGFVVCRLLSDYNCKVVLVAGNPKTDEAKENYKKLEKSQIIDIKDIDKAIDEATVIVDAVYGFGYKGQLDQDIKDIFTKVNQSDARVFSIDINSGSESDTGYKDSSAIQSDVTYALDCLKPIHMLRKEHNLFHDVEVLPLDIPHDIETKYHEMNEDIFFANFPKKQENAYKGSFGKTLIAGGCFGMAGAISLNILGARSVGAPYIEVALPDDIYPIVAGQHVSAVYHPFGDHTADQVIEPLVKNAKATLFGSGAVYMSRKAECLDLILQNSSGPVVLDAEALRLLHQNTYILQFVKCPLVVTPHIAEFAGMINQSVDAIIDHRIEYALQFAKEHKLIVVLKGSNTIVASPNGDVYVNQSGNQALAQAGSGDLLAGMIVGTLTFTRDVYTAVCMAVWLHGYIADKGIEKYSKQNFDFKHYPELLDEFFKQHGY